MVVHSGFIGRDMSIPKWRYVSCLDDGVTEYQCLSCYDTWQLRTPSPKYWTFCPCCGIKWECQVDQDEDHIRYPQLREPDKMWHRYAILEERSNVSYKDEPEEDGWTEWSQINYLNSSFLKEHKELSGFSTHRGDIPSDVDSAIKFCKVLFRLIEEHKAALTEFFFLSFKIELRLRIERQNEAWGKFPPLYIMNTIIERKRT